ncbi:MAG: hypothetical protein ABI343_04560 [Burkholderiaceae bacterium]
MIVILLGCPYSNKRFRAGQDDIRREPNAWHQPPERGFPMTNQDKVGEIRARITRQASDGKFYRFAGDVEKYIEAFDNVEALELQLTDRVGQSTPSQSAQAVTGQAISTSTAAPPGYSFRSDVEAKQAIQALEKSGFDVTKLSLVGQGYHSEEHPVGSSTDSYVLLVHGTFDDAAGVGAVLRDLRFDRAATNLS